MRLAALFAAAVSITACAEPDDLVTDEVEAPDDDGKADAVTELSVRAGETTIWVDRDVRRLKVDGRESWVLHTRTSRNLNGDGRGYIFDDVFGDWFQRSPRTFDVVYGVTSSAPLFDGVNLFLSMGFVHSTGRADSLTARAVVRPRLGATAGSSFLAFTAELTPVVVAGRITYRIEGRATKSLTAIAATAGGVPAQARLVDATHYTIDLDRAQIIALAGIAGSPIVVTGQSATGALVRRAALGLSVKKLGVTTGDSYEAWPLPTCTTATKSCLTAQPAGAIDLGGCGEAIQVNACARVVGSFVDGATVAQTRAAADAKLATFATDATGLVGADNAAAFEAAVRGKVGAAIDDQGGRWYLSPATRDGILAAAVDGPIDGAYARPLALVPAHRPTPGDAAATRQVAADAVLAQIAVQDFVHTDIERTIEVLARELRAQHVADIRAFRDGTDIELFVDGANDIFIGRWLGLHTEVTIDRATGAATHVLVEID